MVGAFEPAGDQQQAAKFLDKLSSDALRTLSVPGITLGQKEAAVRKLLADNFDLNLISGAGGTQRLSRLLGQARAMQMILLGQTISPQRACEYGLALECVSGDVLSRAREVAEQIVARSSRATAHIKQLVRGAQEWSAEEGLAKERTLFCDLMVAPQSLDAMRHMVESGGDIQDTEEQ